jgi:dsDNA-binding SOS-regulon protein
MPYRYQCPFQFYKYHYQYLMVEFLHHKMLWHEAIKIESLSIFLAAGRDGLADVDVLARVAVVAVSFSSSHFIYL